MKTRIVRPEGPIEDTTKPAYTETTASSITELDNPYSYKEPVDSPTLDFANLGLFGRSKETKTLCDCFTEAKKSRQLVLIGGPAGSGKSALAQQLEEVAGSQGGLYAAGKYTVTLQDEPYGAIAQATKQVCLTIQNQKGKHDQALPYDEIRSKLRDELGETATTLRWHKKF